MVTSELKNVKGKNLLYVNGKEICTAAYMTYFEERNDYKNFADAGYRLFSVCTYFSDIPINSGTGFTPCRKGEGIWDKGIIPDFSFFDNEIYRLLKICPDAMIFPRVYITMPLWWIKENPDEVIPLADGEAREAHYSQKYRKTAKYMITEFIDHVRNMPYCDSIIGYQIAGGNTQEWFYFDLNGGYCKNALPYFKEYMKVHNPDVEVKGLPDLSVKNNKENDALKRCFYEFANDEMAETICQISSAAKESVSYSQVIGAFYGYCVEVTLPGWGTHSLKKVLDCKDIDFVCSPVSYGGMRKLGTPWKDMVPSASVYAHNKMYFLECDIRTHLSLYPDECRQLNLKKLYREEIWKGGPTPELSVEQVRKCFVSCLTGSHSFWWFDMFGGWYREDVMMENMKNFLSIMKKPISHITDHADRVAVFIDEKQYIRIPSLAAQNELVVQLACSGVLYDLYIMSDFESQYKNYKAVIFGAVDSTDELARCFDLCKKNNIKYYQNGYECLSQDCIDDLRNSTGLNCIGPSGDMLYVGNGFIALHSATSGKKEIKLWDNLSCKAIFGVNSFDIHKNILTFELEEKKTVLFEVC